MKRILLFALLLTACSRPAATATAETAPAETRLAANASPPADDGLPANDVAEYQPRWRSHTVDSTRYRTVFLAGTIDMGRSENWQAETIARLRDSAAGRWLIFNPRRHEFRASPEEMEYQVRWELEHLEQADRIVMNLLGSSRSPVSLLELGLHARSGRLLVACEPAYYRYDNVRITCARYGIPLYDSLDALLKELPRHFE